MKWIFKSETRVITKGLRLTPGTYMRFGDCRVSSGSHALL